MPRAANPLVAHGIDNHSALFIAARPDHGWLMIDPAFSWKQQPPVADVPEMQPIYDGFVARLAQLGVGQSAPKVGEPFPEFSLPNTRGVYRTLKEVQQGQPLVISFNRGGWCPHCVHELTVWGSTIEALQSAGARLLVVTGELGDGAAALRSLAGGQAAEILCDVDHGLALACGLAFRLADDIRQKYVDAGIDLKAAYGTDSGFLPIPATFILDGEGMVRYALVDPDFRNRAWPPDVVALLGQLG